MSRYFASSSSFPEAFPQIDTFSMSVTVSDGITKFAEKHTYHFSRTNPPPATLRCPKSCDGGGFDLQREIRRAVAARKASSSFSGMCPGRERMSRTQTRSCVARFEGQMELTYKPEEKAAEQDGPDNGS